MRKTALLSCFLILICYGTSFAGFTDNGNGTVTDTRTGLMWQQGKPDKMKWENALEYCENLRLGGKNDWRLPTIKELVSIVKEGKLDPAIDTKYFPNTASSWYWSSSTDASDPEDAWHMGFLYGYVKHNTKSNTYYVRCVRGGQ